MAIKKVVAKKPAESAATPVASVPAKAEAPKAEKKTAAKAAAPKAEKKATAKAAAPKAEKKTAAKAAAPKAEKKTAAKAAPKAEKKTAAKAAPKAEKKTAAVKATSKFEIQFAGKNVTTEEIEAKFVESYGKKAPKEVKFYVKPEENKVYYVVDGDKEHGSFEL